MRAGALGAARDDAERAAEEEAAPRTTVGLLDDQHIGRGDALVHEVAIVEGAETDTVFLNRFSRPALRALRTERTTRLEHEDAVSMMEFGTVKDLYFGGDLEASIALGGQVMGRITAVEPVATILERTMSEFGAVMDSLHAKYGA